MRARRKKGEPGPFELSADVARGTYPAAPAAGKSEAKEGGDDMRTVMMRAKHGWTHVAFVESETDANVEYEIKRHENGRSGCACHAFVFGRGESCKHLRALFGLAAVVPHVHATEVAAPVRVTVGVETFRIRRAISCGPLTPKAVRA